MDRKGNIMCEVEGNYSKNNRLEEDESKNRIMACTLSCCCHAYQSTESETGVKFPLFCIKNSQAL